MAEIVERALSAAERANQQVETLLGLLTQRDALLQEVREVLEGLTGTPWRAYAVALGYAESEGSKLSAAQESLAAYAVLCFDARRLADAIRATA